jgi:S-adenosylmethionine:tRNA ribosyltransferase-isomerase
VIKSNQLDLQPFSYQLPIERIAQRPVYPPESAKLLVSHSDNRIEDQNYSDLPSLLNSKDLLVFNHTQVMPARIRGTLAGGGAAEFLLLKKIASDSWSCLARPLRKLVPGVVVECGEGLLVSVVERSGEKELLVKLSSSGQSEKIETLIDRVGEMPIPPYIRKGHADSQDRSDYQSIFAKHPGSVAAPTASLHFSQKLIDDMAQQGIEHAGIVLHLGSASFLPVYDPERSEELVPPGIEYYVHSNLLLERIAQVRQQGGRVVAVGTSVVRALETMIRNTSREGDLCESSLFITPGFEFKAVDILATNFHQPGTSHLLLVESFIDRNQLAAIYTHALSHDYRFLSYGDGMILFPSNRHD